MWDVADTIASLASAPGGAARGVVRTSGPAAGSVLRCCFQFAAPCDVAALSVPRQFLGALDLGAPLGSVPCRALFWPGPRSYTRQPVLELHTLGSPPVLEAVLRRVCAAGARPAEPGEFTLRAFLAGRIDLVQAEAVLGVIDAAGRRELNTALAQLAGGLSTPLADLRETLLNLLAHLEAGLDFVEEDIEFISPGELGHALAAALTQVRELERQMSQRGAAGRALRVVLLGLPNVGKSSLFNVLCGESAALVANLPGTTRDYVSREVDFHGVRCVLIDTAGWEAADAATAALPVGAAHAHLGRLAQHVASGQRELADLELLCLDRSRPLHEWERRQLAEPHRTPRLVVLTHADRPAALRIDGPAHVTSSVTGLGVTELRAAIAAAAVNAESESGVVGATAVRSRESVRLAGEALERAAPLVAPRVGQELVAAEIRVALEELGKVTGAVYTDDLLDRIFSRFCIGK